MATIFNTAKYILEKSGRMSTMKLQKLCYYSQAWTLVWDDEPLFPEEFEAWANDPVCRELYAATRGKYSVTSDDEIGNSDNLTNTQKENIKRVLAHYGVHNAQWLSQLTHMEEPYRQARRGLPEGISSERIITKASISEYYGGL